MAKFMVRALILGLAVTITASAMQGCGADNTEFVRDPSSIPNQQQRVGQDQANSPNSDLSANPNVAPRGSESDQSASSTPSHTDSEASTQANTEVSESDTQSGAIPMGESGETETDDPGEPTKYTDETGSSDHDQTTKTDEEDSYVKNIKNTGWAPASTPQAWSDENFADFPHVLPERPKALKDSHHMPWTSGRSLAVHNNEMYVVDSDSDSLVVLDRITGKIVRMIATGDHPEQVVVAPNGTVYVTLRYAKSVAKILPGKSYTSQVVNVGTEPYGLALSVDAKTLYVAISAENRLVALKANNLMAISNIQVPSRPRGVAVAQSGHVYVALQFGEGLKVSTEAGTGKLQTIDQLTLRRNNPADLALHKNIKGDKQVPTRSFSVVPNPNNKEVYFAHIEANPGSEEQTLSQLLGTEQETEEKCETTCTQTCKQECSQSCKQVCATSGYYGGLVCTNSCKQNCANVCNDECNTSCVTEIKTFPHLIRPVEMAVTSFPTNDKKAVKVQPSAPVKDEFTGEPMTALCDQPIDVNHHPTESLLFVVCMGSDNLLVLNTSSGDLMRSPVAEIKVGKAPNAIAFSGDGNIAYVRNSQSYSISDVDLSPLFNMEKIAFKSNAAESNFPNWGQFKSSATLTRPIQLLHGVEAAFGTNPFSKELTLGRRIFTFARFKGLSTSGFFACNTCHTDGTEDGLVWFTKEGVRQTPMLAGKLKDTAPFNWIGTGGSLVENIQMTVERMGGSGLTEPERQAVAAYILDPNALRVPPNPHVSQSGALTDSQLKGKELFYSDELGCADCHSGPSMTDGKNWDVGTLSEFEKNALKDLDDSMKSLNTPSLQGLFYSAPYFHDGSADDLYEALNKTAENMGLTYQMSKEQQTHLVNYLLTL